MNVEDLLKRHMCDYDEETPEYMPTDTCFDECAKGEWCKEALPELKQALYDLIMGQIGEDKADDHYLKSNNMTQQERDLIEHWDNGYNKRGAEIKARLERLFK